MLQQAAMKSAPAFRESGTTGSGRKSRPPCRRGSGHGAAELREAERLTVEPDTLGFASAGNSLRRPCEEIVQRLLGVYAGSTSVGKESGDLELIGGFFGEVGRDEICGGAADAGLASSCHSLRSTPQGF
jgi:hypothetical protein